LLEYEDLKEAVVHGIWKDVVPVHISDAADQLMRLKSEDIVSALTRLALTEGALKGPDDFDELFRRNEDEE